MSRRDLSGLPAEALGTGNRPCARGASTTADARATRLAQNGDCPYTRAVSSEQPVASHGIRRGARRLLRQGAAAALGLLLAISALPTKTFADEPDPGVDDTTQAATLADIADHDGALGVYYDWKHDQYVVAVPDSGSSTFKLDEVASLGIDIRVETRAIERTTVDQITEALKDRELGPESKDGTYAAYFDPEEGKYVIRGDMPDEAVADFLSRYPGDTQYVRTKPSRLSRHADVAPHWGGAEIFSPLGECSSGFTVKNANGSKFMITAGHCANQGDAIHGGTGLLWGSVSVRASFPTSDMEEIGGSYEGNIYIGGATGTGSPVKGAINAAVGSTDYCTSGITTFETCGHHVIGLHGMFCDVSGCTLDLMVYHDGTANDEGDSGAPFYNHKTGGGVTVRAIVIATDGVDFYGEKWSSMQSILGVSIVTN